MTRMEAIKKALALRNPYKKAARLAEQLALSLIQQAMKEATK